MTVADTRTDADSGHDPVVAALRARPTARRAEGGVLVPTDVLLPNGATVLAIVQGGDAGDRITAHDGGAALHQVTDAGLPVGKAILAAARIAARQHGVTLEDGCVRTAPEDVADAWAAVVILANATRAVAEAALQAARKQQHDRFRDRVLSQLRRIFVDAPVHAHAPLKGFSEDALRFDWLVGLPGGRQLALDTPVPDSSSVAAVVLRQIDLARKRPEGVIQAIAYDDADAWPSTTIRQLQLARVPVVRAAEFAPTLLRLTA